MASAKTKSKKASPAGKGRPLTSGHCGPFRVAACWPHQEAPLILSMVGAKRTIIATSFTPVAFETLTSATIEQWNDPTCDSSIAADLPRWLFVVPYDTFASTPHLEPRQSERPLAWNVKAALIWDHDSLEPRYVSRPDADSARFHLTMKSHLNSLLAEARKWQPESARPLDLLPGTSDDTYLDATRSILDKIRSGDFYQVNLLRFFHAPKGHGWENLCALMEENTGPHGALIAQGSRIIASMSPEKFIEIAHDGKQSFIETWPIKGTAKRVTDNDAEDARAGEALVNSPKDQAELRMIVDLMRNDLTRVCDDQTVEVLSAGALQRFKHVWHLEGHIKGTLRPGQTLHQLLSAVCPGGSITGAPKIAAMNRIQTDEGQPRGFFMGNVFKINHDGSLESNILIRTLVSDNWMRTARYAAGSGIVIKSSPERELLEIAAKCAPVSGLSNAQT